MVNNDYKFDNMNVTFCPKTYGEDVYDLIVLMKTEDPNLRPQVHEIEEKVKVMLENEKIKRLE
jgi:hypothetical protein